jgi:hypothetical protein
MQLAGTTAIHVGGSAWPNFQPESEPDWFGQPVISGLTL